MPVTSKVVESFLEFPESSSIALRMKAEDYFDVIRSLLDVFARQKNLDSIYVTSTIPSQSIIKALEVFEIALENIYFVDCISTIMMGAAEKHPQAIYVESPTMLENVMLKVEYLHRKTPERNDLVILDSINSLAIHNNPRILSEFLHILVNTLRARNAYTVIFSMAEYETEEITNILRLVCDSQVDVAGEIP